MFSNIAHRPPRARAAHTARHRHTPTHRQAAHRSRSILATALALACLLVAMPSASLAQARGIVESMIPAEHLPPRHDQNQQNQQAQQRQDQPENQPITIENDPDPRPNVLVIGGRNSMSAGISPSWAQLVGDEYPVLDMHVNADPTRVLGEIQPNLDAVLASSPHWELVIIFVGNTEARAQHYAQHDAQALQQQMRDLIEALRNHPKTSDAHIAIATPMPVIDARLDQWNRDPARGGYGDTGGEARCDAIAQAFRQIVKQGGLSLVDVHAAMKARQDEQGNPGQLLGGAGFVMRDWAIPIFAQWMGQQIRDLQPRPRDPRAFGQWRQIQQGLAQLDAILARTSEGLVDHSPALGAAPPPPPMPQPDRNGKPRPPARLKGLHLAVPVDAFQDAQSLEILCKATGPHHAGARVDVAPLVLYVQTTDGPVFIRLPLHQFQTIDQAQPDQPVDDRTYFLNQGRMRYFPVACGIPGRQRWILLRFPLDQLEGKRVQRASITYMPANMIHTGTPADSRGLSPIGGLTMHLVRRRDRQFDVNRATWRTRDGSIGWAGGEVHADARQRELLQFYRQRQRPPVAKAALQYLREAGGHVVNDTLMQNP